MIEKIVIELLKPVTLEKENHPPLVFEKGTILRVLMRTPTGFLVAADSKFNFTVSFDDQDEVWRKL